MYIKPKTLEAASPSRRAELLVQQSNSREAHQRAPKRGVPAFLEKRARQMARQAAKLKAAEAKAVIA